MAAAGVKKPLSAADRFLQQIMDERNKPDNKFCADCDGRVRRSGADR